MSIDTAMTGFSVVEILLALGILSLVAFSGTTTLLESLEMNRLSGENTQALLYAQEGIETNRSIANQNWLAVSTNSSYDTYQNYSRTITIDPVQRNESGVIVSSGGTVDPDTLKISSRVSWDFNSLRSNLVSMVTYLTNWDKTIEAAGNSCDWSSLSIVGSYDKVGNKDATDVFYSGNYAYLVTQDQSGSDEEFFIFDISNPNVPNLTGALNLDENITAVYVQGSYAYLATDANSEDLMIIDVTNTSNPSKLSSLELGSKENATNVWVDGSYAYLTKEAGGGSDRELYLVDVSSPFSPTTVGSLEIGADVNSITVSGNYAYLATSDNSSELIVVDISSKSNPSQIASLDVSGNADGSAIITNEDILYLGRDSSNQAEISSISITSPAVPLELGSFEIGSQVEELLYDHETLFVVSGENKKELQTVEVSTPASPYLLQAIDLGKDANGIGLDIDNCLVATATADNSQELILLRADIAPLTTPTPTPTPTPSPTPTPTPITSCDQYCQSQGSNFGYCALSPSWCSFFSDTYTSAGDTYCGAILDNCCCDGN